MSTPILPFAVWASGTNQNSIPANDNSLRNQILNGLVISQSTTAQPGSPTPGDIYIIASTHTGAQWSTFTPKDLAIYDGATWHAFAPIAGVVVNVAGSLYKYESGAWTLLTSSGVADEIVNPQTGTSYTYLTGDKGKLVTHTNGSPIAGTLPQAGASFPSGWWMDVQNRGAGTLTITPTTSTIDGAASLALTTGQGVRIASDGTNYFTQRGVGSGGGGGSVAGADKQVQYNDGGAFGAEAGFEYDKSTNTLTVDKVRTAASSTTSSGLRVPHGSAPTSPTDGDVWTTSSGIFARINGVTVGPLSAGGSATQGKQTIAVTSGAMRPSLTAGCQPLIALEISSTNPEVVTLNFDATTEESAQFSIGMPKKWNLGTMTVRFRWSHATTTTNFGVVWSIAAVSIGDGETMAGAFGTAQQIADTGGNTNYLYVTSETPALTPATTSGGIAAGDTVFFKVSRKVADGSDTMAVDARLHGLDIFITTNADTDA